MKYEIGQEVEATKEAIIYSPLTNTAIAIRKGDKGFVDSRGSIHYTTGDAKGKIVDSIDVKDLHDYDNVNISKMIVERLMQEYEMKEFMDGYKVSPADMMGTIEDVLMDIL